MKRLLGVLAVALLVFTACGKSDDSPALEGAGDTTMDHGDMGSMSGCGQPAAAATLVAKSAAGYDRDCLSVPANTAFTITFDNRDAGVSHNVAVLKEHTDPTPLFASEVKAGPDTGELKGSPLAAGTYHFHCVVHPTTMKGILQVK